MGFPISWVIKYKKLLAKKCNDNWRNVIQIGTIKLSTFGWKFVDHLNTYRGYL